MSISLFGFDVGWYPALFLLVLLIAGAAGKAVYQQAATMAWSGKRESTFLSRFRAGLLATIFFLALVGVILGMSDITRRYSVEVKEHAQTRTYLDLDLSSSLYKLQTGKSIYCSNANLAGMPDARPVESPVLDLLVKYEYPRIYGSCRMVYRLIDSVEKYTAEKKGSQRDLIGLMSFASESFVIMRASDDYGRARRHIRELNWRDMRMGVSTMYHIALWDMFQVALQRNFCSDDAACKARGVAVRLDEQDRESIVRSLYPEGIGVAWRPGALLQPKLEALRADLRDTTFIIVTDADYRWFDRWLDVAPVSLVKMLQMAEFLRVPVFFVSMADDHKLVRSLTARTGEGPLGGPGRGAFFLLKSDRDFEGMDAVVDNILSRRFRIVSVRNEWRRENYTPLFGLAAALLFGVGIALALSPFGRVIGKGGSP